MPNYTLENTPGPVDVYLDGRLINKTLEADTDEGYVVACKLNSDGEIIPEENGDIATETLYGKVEVVEK